ncbi:hypothetical protein DUI87_19003 [Hirundo rustica rustica]|uniref:Uncharacterized protein n=1 Tax=Hirundo rustica rustica TaxID=333673 RepID=A0A3M0JYJ1_HIRRU|nr:hypothetical protein DUI87_19003 [Hirundo rustica rustica]
MVRDDNVIDEDHEMSITDEDIIRITASEGIPARRVKALEFTRQASSFLLSEDFMNKFFRKFTETAFRHDPTSSFSQIFLPEKEVSEKFEDAQQALIPVQRVKEKVKVKEKEKEKETKKETKPEEVKPPKQNASESSVHQCNAKPTHHSKNSRGMQQADHNNELTVLAKPHHPPLIIPPNTSIARAIALPPHAAEQVLPVLREQDPPSAQLEAAQKSKDPETTSMLKVCVTCLYRSRWLHFAQASSRLQQDWKPPLGPRNQGSGKGAFSLITRETTSIVEERSQTWTYITPSYHIVEQDDVEIVVTNIVNTASFLSENQGEPFHHSCLETIEATYSSCSDLKDTPLDDAETWFTDGSSYVINGKWHAREGSSSGSFILPGKG